MTQNKDLVKKTERTNGKNIFSTEDGTFDKTMIAAKKLSESDLVPEAYRNKPANCLIALDIARQVSGSPFIVMQNLNIIKGKPSWSSTYIAGAIRSRYKNLKVILDGKGDVRGCQVIAYDKDNNIIAEGTRVSIKMAKEEGWFSKKDKFGKECSKWQTMPDLMLQYRAHAFFGRIYCPDILLGLKTEYEMYDIEDIPTVEVDDPFKPTEESPEPAKEKKEKKAEGPEAFNDEGRQILDVQAEIEKYLEKMGKDSSLIFKYAKDLFGKPLLDLNLTEITNLRDKIVGGEI